MSFHLHTRHRKRQQGFIFIVILWIVVVLSVMVLTFNRSMRIQLRITTSRIDNLKALELAKSGVERAIAELRNDDTPDYDDLQESWWDNEDEFRDVEIEDNGEGTYTLLGVNYEDDSKFAYGIVDEERKINLNMSDTELLEEMLTKLLTNLNMDTAIVDSILDWRDSDDNTRPSGAESDYYETLDPPYQAKNDLFESVEELLLVKGIDASILYGEDINMNGVLDANENDGDENYPPDDRNNILDRGLIAYVTVYSSSNNQTGMGSQPKTGAFAVPVQGGKGQGRDQGSGSNQQKDGLININTAPREILEVLPGLDEQKASAIIDYRETTADPLSDLNWLETALGGKVDQRLKTILTVKSNIFTIQSVGRIRRSNVFKRIKVIVDRSSDASSSQVGKVKILYYRDISYLGPPFNFEEESEESRTTNEHR